MRKPREISPMGVYHIIMRGVAKNNVFTCCDDKEKFKEILFRYCEELNIGLISYILMDNHIHLEVELLSDKSCSDLVQRLCISYVQHYFNKRYERSGSLFQSRFKSRGIQTKQDMVNVCKYIHQNALKQGLTKPFKYTSYYDILDYYDKKCPIKAIFAQPITKLMNKRAFKDLLKDVDMISIKDEDYTLDDEQVKSYLCGVLGIESVAFLHRADQTLRNLAIKTLYENKITLKRLSRITSLSNGELKLICFNNR